MKEKETKTQTNGAKDTISFDLEETQLITKENMPLPAPMEAVDLNGNLPDLSEAQESPVDLMADYWTPTQLGECKRVFFDSLKMRTVLDQQTGEQLELLCAYFFEKVGPNVKTISNGSKRLVGIFEGGSIERGTPIQITYLGKKKGTKFFFDDWAVKLLLKQV